LYSKQKKWTGIGNELLRPRTTHLQGPTDVPSLPSRIPGRHASVQGPPAGRRRSAGRARRRLAKGQGCPDLVSRSGCIRRLGGLGSLPADCDRSRRWRRDSVAADARHRWQSRYLEGRGAHLMSDVAPGLDEAELKSFLSNLAFV